MSSMGTRITSCWRKKKSSVRQLTRREGELLEGEEEDLEDGQEEDAQAEEEERQMDYYMQ